MNGSRTAERSIRACMIISNCADRSGTRVPPNGWWCRHRDCERLLRTVMTAAWAHGRSFTTTPLDAFREPALAGLLHLISIVSLWSVSPRVRIATPIPFATTRRPTSYRLCAKWKCSCNMSKRSHARRVDSASPRVDGAAARSSRSVPLCAAPPCEWPMRSCSCVLLGSRWPVMHRVRAAATHATCHELRAASEAATTASSNSLNKSKVSARARRAVSALARSDWMPREARWVTHWHRAVPV